jgi:predicted permease
VAHELWLPLRTDVAGVAPRSGAPIKVFGRLASGMTLENAQAELTSIGQRLAAELPETHTHIQPHVLPYAQLWIDDDDGMSMMMLTNFLVFTIVVVVCSTVALLVFARAASRESEILVRSALGASRRRIVTQLFVEALVLSGVATAVGLLAAQLSLTLWGEPYLEMNYGMLPFWYDFDLSPTTIAYALALALVGAVVAGVLPARRITRGLGQRLREGTAGSGGVSFGGVWTAVIVAQVALTVVLPSVAMIVRGEVGRITSYDMGVQTDEYLGVSVAMDGPNGETPTPETTAALEARAGASLEALRRRLETEPGVAGVTFVDALPQDGHDGGQVEVQLETLPENPRAWVATAAIDPTYFDVLNVPMIAGRAFTHADLAPGAHVVIVDEGFVARLMGGRNPIGQRVRFVAQQTSDSTAVQQPWYEIVGLVRDLGMGSAAQSQRPAGLYLPAAPGTHGALTMIVHAPGDALALAPRVRELATAIDPEMRIETVTRLDHVVTPLLWFLGVWMRVVFGLTAVFLLLSLSGIYAVLSFIVARRTREIGVRVAIGASARRVILAIFRRPLVQVSLGVVAGSALIGMVAIAIQNTTQFAGTETGGLAPGDVVLLAGYALLMLGVCMLACIVPTLRALRVEPTQALRAE